MIFAFLMIVIMVVLDAMFYYFDLMLGAGGYYFLMLSGWFDLIIMAGFWGIQEFFLTPTSAKRLRDCKSQKRMPIIVEHDNKVIEIKVEKERTPEGGIKTKDGFTGFIPRGIVASNDEDAKTIGKVSRLVSQAGYMPDIGMPVMCMYSGKGVLTNFKTLAELEHATMPTPNPGVDTEKDAVEVAKEGDDGKTKTRVVNLLWPVSVRKLKEYFSKSWNQATIRAIEQESEAIGAERERKKHMMEKGYIYFILALAALFGMAIIFVVVSRMG